MYQCQHISSKSKTTSRKKRCSRYINLTTSTPTLKEKTKNNILCWQHGGNKSNKHESVTNKERSNKEALATFLSEDELREIDIEVPFTLILDNKARKIPYRRCPEKICSLGLHLGQRKLLLTEIMFLTKYGHLANLVIYIGAAPGLHTPYLSELFPEHKFILYDPVKFGIQATSKIILQNKYFTKEEAEKYKDNQALFISDIRVFDKVNSTGSIKEESILEDMDLQKECLQILNPKASMLKFRLPWSTEEHKTNPEKNRIYKYLKGTIYIQPFAPTHSTETRLIVLQKDNYRTENYDYVQYEEQMRRHNLITRIWQWFPHEIHIDEIQNKGLDHCYDCSAEIEILKDYLKYMNKQKSNEKSNEKSNQKTINDKIAQISATISQKLHTSLDKPPHGYLPNKRMIEKWQEVIDMKKNGLKVKRHDSQKEFLRSQYQSQSQSKSQSSTSIKDLFETQQGSGKFIKTIWTANEDLTDFITILNQPSTVNTIKHLMKKIIQNNNLPMKYNDSESVVNNLYTFYTTTRTNSNSNTSPNTNTNTNTNNGKWGHTKQSLEKTRHKFSTELELITTPIHTYVDYGCGDGSHALSFSELIQSENNYCLDIQDFRRKNYISNTVQFESNPSKNSLLQLFSKSSPKKSPAKTKTKTSPKKSPKIRQSVDLITLLQTLHHVEFKDLSNTDPEDKIQYTLKQITKISHPDTFLLIREHDVDNEEHLTNVIIEHLIYDILELPNTENNNNNNNKNNHNHNKSKVKFIKWLKQYANTHKGWYFSKETLHKWLTDLGWTSRSFRMKEHHNVSRIYNELWQKN